MIKTIRAGYNDGREVKDKETVIVCEKCKTEYRINFEAQSMSCCGESWPKNKYKEL